MVAASPEFTGSSRFSTRRSLHRTESMVTPAPAVYSPIVSRRGVPPLIPSPVIAGVVAEAMPRATADKAALSDPLSRATVTVVSLAAKLEAVIWP